MFVVLKINIMIKEAIKTNLTYKVPARLLSSGFTNAKTKKNKLKTFILYLSPHKQNSKKKNLCPFASEGCASACLYTAGRGKFSNVQNARINKTEYFLSDKIGFLNQLLNELIKEYKKAEKNNYKIAVRLNGTSDIDFLHLLKNNFNFNLDYFGARVLFYDYTKDFKRALKYKEDKFYSLTFSRSETNFDQCKEALKQGVNISAVFSGDLPEYYKGFKVVDGDTADDIMINESGVILGLRAKGEGKKDKSGFVINNY